MRPSGQESEPQRTRPWTVRRSNTFRSACRSPRAPAPPRASAVRRIARAALRAPPAVPATRRAASHSSHFSDPTRWSRRRTTRAGSRTWRRTSTRSARCSSSTGALSAGAPGGREGGGEYGGGRRIEARATPTTRAHARIARTGCRRLVERLEGIKKDKKKADEKMDLLVRAPAQSLGTGGGGVGAASARCARHPASPARRTPPTRRRRSAMA